MNWSRAERWLWFFFLVTASWQTRVFFLTSRPFSEWLSGAFWLADACILALVVFALASGWRIRRIDRADGALILLVAAAAVSTVTAVDRLVSLVALARLAEFSVFFLYLRHWAFRRFDPDASALAFVAGALLEAGLGIAQYAVQRDIGLRCAGETPLRTDMHGVAVFLTANGMKVLRAYGTLPHPNVLAAWLLAALALTVWLYVRHGKGSVLHQAVWAGAAGVLAWGMYLTFSRTVIAMGALAAVAVAIAAFAPRLSDRWPNIRQVRRQLARAGVFLIAVTMLFAVLFWPVIRSRASVSSSDEAVRLRLDYARDALASGGIRVNWTGVGIGGFVPWLMRYDPLLPAYLYQPAHSVPLLAYAETGVLGTAALAWLLVAVALAGWQAHRTQPLIRWALAAFFAAWLLTGATDHFFVTLEQGRILWWGMLALVAGTRHARIIP